MSGPLWQKALMFNLFSSIIFVINKILLTRQINSNTHQYAATFIIASFLC